MPLILQRLVDSEFRNFTHPISDRYPQTPLLLFLSACMTTLPFETLGFSQLFVDFIAQRDIVASRFSANADLFSPSATLSELAASNPHRSLFTDAIAATMAHVEQTQEQQQNFHRLTEPSSLTVITGQQVGFLGGALYTMLKAWTAVQSAEKLAAAHTGLNFVPIFWIEDNDHDIDEISHVSLLSQSGEAFTLRSSWNSAPAERTPAADVVYDEAIISAIEEAIEALPNSEHSHTVAELLQEAYTPGTSVVMAFVKVLQRSLGASGILFVSAAELRKRGLFRSVVAKELAHIGSTADTVHKASQQLLASGYHGQAQASAVNLFLHIGGKRHKITTLENGSSSGNERLQAGEIVYTKAELQALAAKHPEQFSPAVLLRPLVQDAIFPNAAYIGGPGEIAYLAQIQELYPLFGVPPTATLARHSVTLTDARTEQLCAKLGVATSFFLRRYDAVEKDIMHEQENKHLAAALETAKVAIKRAFADVQPHILALDPTLVPTSDRMKNQALQGVSDLEAKVRKAQKRLEETTLGKARKASSLLYPEGGLQERALPYVYFAAKIGFDALATAMRHITSQPATAHILLSVDTE